MALGEALGGSPAVKQEDQKESEMNEAQGSPTDRAFAKTWHSRGRGV